MSIVKQQFLFLFISCLSVIFTLLINNNFEWIFEFSDHRASILIHYGFINFIHIFSRNSFLTIFISQFSILLLIFINNQKTRFLSLNLIPQDLYLIRESIISSPISLKLIVFITLILFIIIAFFIYKKSNNNKLNNIIVSFLISMTIYSFFIAANYSNRFEKYCLTTTNWLCERRSKLPDTRSNWKGDTDTIKKFGFFTFLTNRIIDISYTKFIANDYLPQESEITTIYQSMSSQTISTKISTDLPNIIFIMNESFWDATKLSNNIPKNLTPTIYKKPKSVLSPSFGGGTANVEFEVLTSLNVLLNQNRLAYTNQITKPIYSLPEYMNRLGYNTTALHNNDAYFYHRNITYTNLGFKDFISLEDMIDYSKREKYTNLGNWITDSVLFFNIEKILLKSIEEPQFIYATTVENHGPYIDERFGNNIPKFNYPSNMKLEEQQVLNTYLAGLKRADSFYLSLITYASKIERPTIIVFFGDHLPNLGAVYNKFHYFKNPKEELEKNDQKFFTTPLALWSNFEKNPLAFSKDSIQAPFLALETLKAANIPLPTYYQFIDKVNNCFSKIHRTGIIETTNCETDHDEVLNQYKLLHLDILDGENHTYKILNNSN